MNRLRELRAGRYTQAEMAELLGVGRTTYTKYERGDIRLSAEVLEKLAQVFDVSVDYILGRDEAEDDAELWDLREALRRDPERRILFSLARSATLEEVRQAVAVIDALKRSGGGAEDAGARDADDPA
ncbi:MAG: helix-turn-helix domain-containing protein [Clostridia bacterium]|nr:helix-turn-helix domain-containing protein [Clostridia bacterium]